MPASDVVPLRAFKPGCRRLGEYCPQLSVALRGADPAGGTMGNRANIVLVDHDGWQLRYSHWAGCRMLDALLAGPEMATRYILAQETSEFWTDDLWSDGGLLLDLVAHRLLFFGEEIMTRMNERRAMFQVLEILWSGYSISWAYGATAEIAAYVGARIPLCDNPSRPELKTAADADRLHHLVTVTSGNGRVRAWPLWWGSSAAWHGPQLLDMLPGTGKSSLRLGILPESGVHIDETNETVGVWVTNPNPGLVWWLPQLWPGWRAEFWEDRYEEQLRRCGPLITAPALDVDSGAAEAKVRLKERIFQRREDSPAGQLSRLAELLVAAGLPIPEVSASAVVDVGERPSPAEWACFERACARVRASGNAA
ncbi:MAG: hypothetical protein WCZ29_15735 [Mycolicibacterium vanbaalenii]|uniref:hypothetical protein n=1 Tax=Mycolicibacterium vanbaalenii TaxID=110539 RepID=UPI003566109E